MHDDSQATFVSHPACSRFGEELPIENHNSSRLSLIDQLIEFSRHIPRRQNIFAEKITRIFIIIQVMDAQDPTQTGQTQCTEREVVMSET